MPEPEDRTLDLAIDDRKITAYLLNVDHIEGGPKARFFIARGFDPQAPLSFVHALLEHGRPSHLVGEAASGFGVKYVYEGALNAPDGTTPRVRSVWHRRPGGEHRLLVTAYPI